MTRSLPFTLSLFLLPLFLSAQTNQSNSAPVGTMAVVGDSSLVVVELQKATVSAKVEPIKIKEDTVEYNPAAYRLQEDAMLEDLLRKIPGIELNGNTVMLHGREVKQILIDGQRFFGGNVKLGIQNISADMISKINAYERESDFTRMTGIDDGETEPVLDLKIKKNMMDGWRGNISGGYGMHNRYIGRLNANKIKKNSQNTAVLNFNNMNGKISINNASRTQLGGGSSADVHKREAGLNMSRKSDKSEWDANVHYGGNDRNVSSLVHSEKIYSNKITSYNGFNNGNTGFDQPTFNGRFILRPSKSETVLIKPSFKYTNTRNLNNTQGTNLNEKKDTSNWVNNDINTKRNQYFSDLELQYTKRFDQAKKGRNVSVLLYNSVNASDESSPQTFQTFYKNAKKNSDRRLVVGQNLFDYNGRIQLAYNEPLGKRGFHIQSILVGYYQRKTSDRNVYDMKSYEGWNVTSSLPEDYRDHRMDEISSAGTYDWYSFKALLNFKYIRKKFNITLGLSCQPQWTRLRYVDTLNRDTVVNNFLTTLAPNINIVYRHKKTEKLSLTYRAYSSLPSLYNLLPVCNGTNPLYVHYGNENLIPAYVHRIEFSYNKSNLHKQSSIVTNVNARINQHQVTGRTVYDPSTGGSISRAENIEGCWNIDGSMAYNKSFGSSWSIVQHASGNYSRDRVYLYQSKVTEINDIRRVMVKEVFETTYRNDWLEVQGNVNGDFTWEASALRPEVNQTPWSLGAGLKANAVCPWGMRVVVDYSFLAQRGYAFDELNRNYHVLNASISQPFLKRKLILSVEAYDVLDQLPNLTRTFSGTGRSISLFNGYNAYILGRLVYKFSFKKKG